MTFAKKVMLTGLLIVPSIAVAQVGPKAQTEQVLSTLHHADLMEIAMGGLASTKAEAVGVRQYGQQLMKDHRLADQLVADLAKQENVRLEGKAHSASEHETMERLKKAGKRDFDREFLNAMVEDHEKDINMVKRAQGDTDDQNLKALLQKLLPTLEQHLDTARGLLSQTR